MKQLEITINIAIAFFTIGTLLFLAHVFFKDYIDLLVIGFFYFLSAILLNSLVLVALIAALIVDH